MEFFQNLLNRMRGKKSEVLTEGTPGTVVEGGKVISSDAPGNTSFFGGLFGGQSSKPFQNQRAQYLKHYRSQLCHVVFVIFEHLY